MKKQVLAFLCALLLLAGAVPAAAALEGESLRAADTLTTLGLLDAGAGDSLDQPGHPGPGRGAAGPGWPGRSRPPPRTCGSPALRTCPSGPTPP